MNKEIKQQWVAALRSGDYRQGTGTLKNRRGEFCCLGVLCDLAEKAGVVTWKDNAMYHGYASPSFGHLAINSTLPLEVKIWADLNTRNPSVVYDSEYEALSSLNDVLKLSLNKIADVIEKQL